MQQGILNTDGEERSPSGKSDNEPSSSVPRSDYPPRRDQDHNAHDFADKLTSSITNTLHLILHARESYKMAANLADLASLSQRKQERIHDMYDSFPLSL